ncbi:PREDICTED: trimethyllysine dioxygenase, mitochondrial-like, partial [Priapulus caudatus]|uniref:trimethyllysine dioxygenase n=1 Tax=Priapulus caudatus TaxID=37621 RepID=A0ABM1DZE2_PRICU
MLLRRLQQCVSRVCWSHPAASDFGRQAGARLFRMAAPACQAFTVMTTRDEHLELNIAGLKSPIRLNYMWLRDHCYCEKCYSRDTFQKKFDTHSLEKSVVPDEIFLEDETLCLLWPDGHRTTFQLGWLLQNSYDGHRQVKDVTKVLWDANHIKQLNPAMVPHRMFMDTQDSLKQLLLNINTYGFGIVDSVPATEEATGAVAERVCRMHENIYGKLWSFSTDMTHSDTAYTNLALGAHTDNTYLEDCPGIQIFHCLQHDGNGGETLLVDGFNAADQLRKTNREAFEVLCESCVSSEFIDARGGEKLHHMHRTDSILQVNAITNELARIRSVTTIYLHPCFYLAVSVCLSVC